MSATGCFSSVDAPACDSLGRDPRPRRSEGTGVLPKLRPASHSSLRSRSVRTIWTTSCTVSGAGPVALEFNRERYPTGRLRTRLNHPLQARAMGLDGRATDGVDHRVNPQSCDSRSGWRPSAHANLSCHGAKLLLWIRGEREVLLPPFVVLMSGTLGRPASAPLLAGNCSYRTKVGPMT
jgi:hypothetical protein